MPTLSRSVLPILVLETDRRTEFSGGEAPDFRPLLQRHARSASPLLEDEIGDPRLVSADQLADALGDHLPRLLFLSACETASPERVLGALAPAMLEYMIAGQLQGVGATYVIVAPDSGNDRPGVAARQVKLTWEDGQAVRQKVAGVRLITPVLAGQGKTVKYADRDHLPFAILGVNQDAQEVLNFAVGQGRFFSAVDIGGHRQVAVIGQEIVDELKLGRQPLGKEIYLGKRDEPRSWLRMASGGALGVHCALPIWLCFGVDAEFERA